MASIADTIILIYKVNDYKVNLVSIIYFILFAPGVIISMLVYNKFSLKTGIIIGVFLQTIGAITK